MTTGIFASNTIEASIPVPMVDIPYGPVRVVKLDLPLNRVIKRSVDIILGGILALLILPWFIPMVAIIIKLDSKGPVFFVQKTTGRSRKTFYCIKLRTMRVNKEADRITANDPVLVSKNYSLFTDVDMVLAANERMGIRVQALKAVDDNSLFTPTLGDNDTQAGVWETVDESSSINMRQFTLTVLKESDLIDTSESVDIIVRFPVFQVQKPVRQWNYNFNLQGFRQAVRHADENCTAERLLQLVKENS